jgi:hypothetical protein
MESMRKAIPRPYYKIYRVDKNDTAIAEIPVNDLRPVRFPLPGTLSLQPGADLFSLYKDIGQAMEKAKAGAQDYIEGLISRGEEGLPELLQYRMDHYEDLHINLVDANIRKEEEEMQSDLNFEYKPYRIATDSTDDDKK